METPKRNALLGDIIDIEAGNIFGLFKEWYERTEEIGHEPKDGDGHYCLVCDGIVRKREKGSTHAEDEATTEMRWEQDKKRVAFLIKDENQKGSIWADDTRNWLVETPADNTPEKLKVKQNSWDLKRKFLRNIANILWGITNCTPTNPCPASEIHSNLKEIKDTFQDTPFALIECKKQGGKPSISDKTLEKYLNDYKELLYKEFDILEPHIYVCTNEKIYDFVQAYILTRYPNTELTRIHPEKHNRIRLHYPSKTIILCSYHPSARMSYEDIYNDVMDHYRTFVQDEKLYSRIF